MSSNWPEFSIDSLKADKKNAIAMGPFGSRIKAENFVSSGIPVIKGGNLNGDFINEDSFDYLTVEKADELISSNAYRRDIVITHRGTIGQVGLIPDDSKHERYIVSQSQLKVTLDQEKVNPYFVYYFLRSPLGQHRLLMNASQVGVPAIAQASTSVKAIMVPCPDLDIQDRIVEILLSIDKKLKSNTQTNQTLEQIAQALFKSWFVDFDPVKAKISALEAGGTTEEAELAAMSMIAAKSSEQLAELKQSKPDAYEQLAQTAALFPSAMQESELGEIPEGWNVNRISEFGSVMCGKTPSKVKPEFFGEDIPFIKIPDMHNSMFVVKASEYLSQAGAKSQAKKNLPRGSICVSSIATVGKVVITREPSQTNQQINSILPHEVFYTPYLYFYMGQLEKHFHDLASGGSATLNMNTSTFSKVNLLNPSKDILICFHETTKGIISLIESNMLSNLALGEMRDAMLPELLSGNKGGV